VDDGGEGDVGGEGGVGPAVGAAVAWDESPPHAATHWLTASVKNAARMTRRRG
jgi:hypothetical protein